MTNYMDGVRLKFIPSRHIEAGTHPEPAGKQRPKEREKPQPDRGKHLAHPSQKRVDVADPVDVAVAADTAWLFACTRPHVFEAGKPTDSI